MAIRVYFYSNWRCLVADVRHGAEQIHRERNVLEHGTEHVHNLVLVQAEFARRLYHLREGALRTTLKRNATLKS